jgi:hypothetical protein
VSKAARYAPDVNPRPYSALEFKRDAGSLVEAIQAARVDVMVAIPTALLIN